MPFQVIAHRGAMGYERQNTLSSFRRALELEADGLELDVFLSKDGHLFVFHDEMLEELTKASGHPSNLTLQELQELEVNPPEGYRAKKLHHSEIRIPSLAEVLELVGGYEGKKSWINIELKGEGTEYAVPGLVRHYDRRGLVPLDRILVSSFDHDGQLRTMRDSNPRLRLGVLFSGILTNLNEQFELYHPYSVHPDVDTINQKLVDDAHERGFKVYAWTVNKEWQARKVVPLGIDGAFTNYPDRMKELAAKYSPVR